MFSLRFYNNVELEKKANIFAWEFRFFRCYVSYWYSRVMRHSNFLPKKIFWISLLDFFTLSTRPCLEGIIIIIDVKKAEAAAWNMKFLNSFTNFLHFKKKVWVRTLKILKNECWFFNKKKFNVSFLFSIPFFPFPSSPDTDTQTNLKLIRLIVI